MFKRVFQTLMIIIVAIYLFSCGGDGSLNEDSDSSNVDLSRLSVKISVPINSDNLKIETYSDLQDFSQGMYLDIYKVNSLETIKVKNKYASTILEYPLFSNDNNNEIAINESTTADSIILNIPELILIKDVNLKKEILNKIKLTPEYELLIQSINNYLRDKESMFMFDVYEYPGVILSVDRIIKNVLPKVLTQDYNISVTNLGIKSLSIKSLSSVMDLYNDIFANDLLFDVFKDGDHLVVKNPYPVHYGLSLEENLNSVQDEFIKIIDIINPTTNLIAIDLKFWPPYVDFKDGFENVKETKIPLTTFLDGSYPIYLHRNSYTFIYDFLYGFSIIMDVVAVNSVKDEIYENLKKYPDVIEKLKELSGELRKISYDKNNLKSRVENLYKSLVFSELISEIILKNLNKYNSEYVSYETFLFLKNINRFSKDGKIFLEKFFFKRLGISKSFLLENDIEQLIGNKLNTSLTELLNMKEDELIKTLKNYYDKIKREERIIKIFTLFNMASESDSVKDAAYLYYNAYLAFYDWAKDIGILDKIMDVLANKYAAKILKGKIEDILKGFLINSGRGSFYVAAKSTNEIIPFIVGLLASPDKIKFYYDNGNILKTEPPTLKNLYYYDFNSDNKILLRENGNKIILKNSNRFMIGGIVEAKDSFDFIHNQSKNMFLSHPERDVIGVRIYKNYLNSSGKKSSELVYEFSRKITNPFLGREKVIEEEYRDSVVNRIEPYIEDFDLNGDIVPFNHTITFSNEEKPLGITILYWNADYSVVKKIYIPIELEQKKLIISDVEQKECGRVRFRLETDYSLDQLEYTLEYIDVSSGINNISGKLSDTINREEIISLYPVSTNEVEMIYDYGKVKDYIDLTLMSEDGIYETKKIVIENTCLDLQKKLTLNISNLYPKVGEEVSIKYDYPLGKSCYLKINSLDLTTNNSCVGNVTYKFEEPGVYIVYLYDGNEIINSLSVIVGNNIIAQYNFEDSFRNSVTGNNDKRLWENSDSVLIENGYLRLINEYDNDNKSYVSLIIDTENTHQLVIEKKTKLIPKDNYFIASTSVEDSLGNIVSITYNNYHYNNGDLHHTILVENTEHFYIFNRWNYVDANEFEYRISPLINPIWNEWFYERITIDYVLNEVRYDISKDGKIYQTLYISNIELTNDLNTKLTFSTFDWASGSEHLVDYLKIYKIEKSEDYNNINLKNGLIAYYSFDGCAVMDDSGNGNNGTLYGSPECVNGISGNAFKFGGYYDPDYIEVPNSSSLSFIDNFSFVFWFNIQNVYGMDGLGSANEFGKQTMLAKSGDREGLNIAVYQDINNPGTFKLSIHNGRCCSLDSHGLSAYSKDEISNIKLNEWHMVAVVADGTYIRIYVDGVLRAIESLETFNINPLMSQSPLRIGIDEGAVWYPFNGIIDEVRIYNRSLTEEEIMDLFLQN